MRFVLVPDSFKESMSSRDAALAMQRGIRRALPDAETVLLPIADGGEGTLDTLMVAGGGTTFTLEVAGPLGAPTLARFGILGDGATGVVEMAEASGLRLVPPAERNPLATTTYGTGELIRAALDRDVTRLVVAIGGSATNDAGAGALQALGACLLDDTGRPIGFGGGSLGHLATIDLSTLDPRLRKVEMQVACDVTNPLCGPRGRARCSARRRGRRRR